MSSDADTVGLILAGGAGRRLGGRDKAWLILHGRPLICHAHAVLAPQVDRVLVASSRHRWAYHRIGLDVQADREDWRGRGPLAAIAHALATLCGRRLALLPVDVPQAPDDYVGELAHVLDQGHAAAALTDGQRRQPLLALLDRSLAQSAICAVESPAMPSMQAWLDSVGVCWLPRPGSVHAYANINTRADLDQLRGRRPEAASSNVVGTAG